MADGLGYTPGAGSTVLTDDTGAGGHAQVVKLAISTDGSGTLIPADATNGIDVDVTRLPALVAGTANIGDVDVLTVPAPLSTTGGGTEATALRVTIATDSTGVVSVDDNGAALSVDWNGTTPVTGSGTATGALRVELPTNGTGTVTLNASTGTQEVVGDVAHSVAVAGNPVLIAGAAQAHDDTAPPNRVDAEGDATRLATDYDGSLFVRPHGPQVWTYHLNTSTAQTDASVHSAPGAGLSLYVGTIVFSSGAATAINMFLEEGASTVMGPYYLEATAGRGLCIQFNPPRKITANTALTITTSASIAHAVDITGFTAQG